jgi:hypothetical protein
MNARASSSFLGALVVAVLLAGFVCVGVPVSAGAAGTAPVVSNESSSNVGQTGATLSAQIEAGGEQTSYRLEYGTSEAYGSSTPEASLGDPTGPVGVQVHLTGLQSGATYHFRFVATNPQGDGDGVDSVFTTLGAAGPSQLTLPDDRAYELVSSAENQEANTPFSLNEHEEDNESGAFEFTGAGPRGEQFRAAAGGGAVAYVAAPPVSGVSGNGAIGAGQGNQWFATRESDGWVSRDITPTGSNINTVFEGFSSDLGIGVVHSYFERLTPDGPACRQALYVSAADGGLSPLFETPPIEKERCGEPVYAGMSADGSRVLMENEAILTGEAEPTDGEEGHYDLYEAVDGQLRSVNVLNGKPDPNATFGGPSETPEPRPDFSNVISDDGTHVFWTDLNTHNIYMRVDGTSTVAVSLGAAQYWSATPDGRYVFYTENEKLWRYDTLSETRQELVGEGAVKGVVATSQDGAIVYFVAAGALASNGNSHKEKAIAQACTPPTEGSKEGEEENRGDLKGRGCNLYLLHVGKPVRFIAMLAPRDNNIEVASVAGLESGGGDWQPDLAVRSAEATPDGHSLVFESIRSLTGYDNASPAEYGAGLAPALETFVYSTESDKVSCVSCTPSGAPPAIPADIPNIESSWYPYTTWLPASLNRILMFRWLADGGNEVFFDTQQALVPQDANGHTDVYEWESEGTGSCTVGVASSVNDGCVFLLSGGTSSNDADFMEASEDGGEVFFVSRAQLAPQDGDERLDVYDARVDGGFPVLSLACTGTGCQGVPPAPPVFASPASATFAGVANFPHVTVGPSGKLKAKSKATRCRRGYVKRRGKCVKKSRKGRAGRSSKRGRK